MKWRLSLVHASNRIRVKTKQREQTFIYREQQSPRVTSHYIFPPVLVRENVHKNVHTQLLYFSSSLCI